MPLKLESNSLTIMLELVVNHHSTLTPTLTLTLNIIISEEVSYYSFVPCNQLTGTPVTFPTCVENRGEWKIEACL
jgi:hypothetical protein